MLPIDGERNVFVGDLNIPDNGWNHVHWIEGSLCGEKVLNGESEHVYLNITLMQLV